MITEKEAAIISAYTGILLGRFSRMHEYVEQIMGQPVFTYELADKELTNKIKQKSKQDFCNLIVINSISANERYGKDVKPEPICKCKTCRKLHTPKPLAEYLAEYLATGINRTHEAGMPVDFTEEGLRLVLEQALDAYESTENVKIKIEKQ